MIINRGDYEDKTEEVISKGGWERRTAAETQKNRVTRGNWDSQHCEMQ